MYSVFQIYKDSSPIYLTYHTLHDAFKDHVKLDVLLNTPTTPYYLVDQYFKSPTSFSIQTIATGISNALEVNRIIKETINTTIDKPKKATKTRKKKVVNNEN